MLERKEHNLAICKYTEALYHAPDNPILYSNRAAALLRRGWYGDNYAAVRDCNTALHLDPMYVKAHFRMARALSELNLFTEAKDCHTELKQRFSTPAWTKAIDGLGREIEDREKVILFLRLIIILYSLELLSFDSIFYRGRKLIFGTVLLLVIYLKMK